MQELTSAYTAAKNIVILRSFEIRYALAAGEIKKDIVSIAPTDSNAETAVNETKAIKT